MNPIPHSQPSPNGPQRLPAAAAPGTPSADLQADQRLEDLRDQQRIARTHLEGPQHEHSAPGAIVACKHCHDHHQRLSVTSINIRFDTGRIGNAPGPNNWAGRRDYLAEVVKRDHPHIVGTQEGDRQQLQEFNESLGPDYRMAESHRTWGTTFYPTLFFNPDHVQVHRSGDAWLSPTPDVPQSKLPGARYPRLMTWAEVEHEGKRLFVVNTHLSNVNPALRQRQARILVEQIQRHNSEALPLLVMGDFNEAAGGRVMDTLLDGLPDLIDPWQELELREKSSYNGFNKTSFDPGRIDWVLQSRELQHPLIQIRDDYRLNPDTHDVQYPSDHNPVNLTIGD